MPTTPPKPRTSPDATASKSPAEPHPAMSAPTYRPSPAPTNTPPTGDAAPNPQRAGNDAQPPSPRPQAAADHPARHDQPHRQALRAQPQPSRASGTPANTQPAPTNAPPMAMPHLRRPLALRTGTTQPTQPVQPKHPGTVPTPHRPIPLGDQRPHQDQPESPAQQSALALSRVASPTTPKQNASTSRTNLTRVTINLHPAAKQAAAQLFIDQNLNLTDAINRALRIAAIISEIAPDNRLRVVRPDGTVADIYVV